jgi:hypothetical protein
MSSDNWKWALACGCILFISILTIFIIVLHYKGKYELTEEKMEKIKEARDLSIVEMNKIEESRRILEVENTQLISKLKEREETLSKTLTELTRLSRETDEKINNPPALDIESIGSWIKTKIAGSGTP